MKIGVIVYSQTGNTRAAAERVEAALSEKGHDVRLEQIRPEDEVHPGTKHVRFLEAPDVTPYEGIVFAAPVQAFSLASGMKAYMREIGPLDGKKIACFVTKQLPGKWTGGNHAVSQLSGLCREHGAGPAAGNIIIWSSKDREKMIEETAAEIAGMF
ncbi:MAG: flavodoxin [Spirochaetota bacterium]|nr:flavodoxin [Spirochaetota bacterium]